MELFSQSDADALFSREAARQNQQDRRARQNGQGDPGRGLLLEGDLCGLCGSGDLCFRDLRQGFHGAAAQQAHGLGPPGEQRVIGEQADGLVGSCSDCGGLGHRRDLGGQRDGGGRLVQTQLLGVVPPPSPEGAVSQDHGGVAGARADRSDGAGGGEGKGQGLQLGAGLVGGVSLAAVAQLAVDVAPHSQRVPSARRAAAW